MTLSIIIPCYNAEPYIHELLRVLDTQVKNRDNVEVIIVDDGSEMPFITTYEWAKVIRQKNGGASSARNRGLAEAQGEYIAFIDADDLISRDYIPWIIGKIEHEEPDFIYLSWRTLPGGWQCEVRLKSIEDEFPSFNLCVWNRIYKRELIGKTKFNEKKLIAEDAEFIREVETKGKKKAFISEPIYFYRSNTPDSLTKRFAKGELNTKRVVYHLPHITKEMKYLLKEIKEADKEGEVIIMTNQNDIPELARYAMVTPPQQMKGTELRGEPTPLFTKITLPITTQVVIFTSCTFQIGGIETWIYNFCQNMKDHYDILVLFDSASPEQIERLSQIVQTRKNDGKKIICDTLIINRITDEPPKNVEYKQTVQMIHAMKLSDNWKIPKGRDKYIAVSKAVRDSFGQGEVIHNMSYQGEEKEALLLVSATRLSTFEKGADRISKFAKGLEENGIPYLWMIFSDKEPPQMTKSMCWLSPRLNIKPYIEKADYLVQLSDQEGFCYSIIEAWEMGTPVISTPIDVLKEIGFVEGVNGYTVPFSMRNIDFEKFLQVPDMMPQFYSNKSQIEKWRKVLGNTQPTRSYKPEAKVKVISRRQYKDVYLGRIVEMGEMIEVPQYRADLLVENGFGRLQGGKI